MKQNTRSTPEELRNWSAWPASVGVLITTREGGVSAAPFDSLNLGAHVGDASEAVAENRRRFRAALGDGVRPMWLDQVHGTNVVVADEVDGPLPRADAAVTDAAGVACVVMTADCLPVLLTHRSGRVVGAAHAGWRGLCDGVVERTLDAMGCAAAEVVAYLGPAIGPEVFEVGPEVREKFLVTDRGARSCFEPSPWHPDQRYVADLYELCRRRLRAAGVIEVGGGAACTFREEERYFSYRRDGRTGRMASAIWRLE